LEQITYQSRNTSFVRINTHNPQVPDEIGEKAISLTSDAFDAIRGIWQLAYINSTIQNV